MVGPQNLIHKLEKKHWCSIFLILSTLIVILTDLTPHFFQEDLISGQLTKQAVTAELIQSYLEGKVSGVFSFRDFLEIYQDPDKVWTCEFPIYHFMVWFISKITGLSLSFSSKILGIGAYLSLVILSFLWNRANAVYSCLILLSFPIFKIYSVSIMPDFLMGATLAWGTYFFLKEKKMTAFLFLSLSALLKIYAIFFIFSLMLYRFFQDHRKSWKDQLTLAMSALPGILYILYILTFQIPNPISEYAQIGHAGHVSTLDALFRWKTYSRLSTWFLMQNPTPIGALFILIGLFSFIQKKNNIPIIIAFAIGSISFLFAFLSGHIIHDYYSLPIFFCLIFLGAIGIEKLLRWPTLLILLWSGHLTFSHNITSKSLFPQWPFLTLKQVLVKYTNSQERGLVMGDRAVEIPHYLSHRSGFTFDLSYLENDVLLTELQEVLQKRSIHWILIYIMNHGDEKMMEKVMSKSYFSQYKLKEQGHRPSDHRRVPSLKWRLYMKELDRASH